MYPIDRWLATHGTAIYYLLTQDTFSQLHRLTSDEVFHHLMLGIPQLVRRDPGRPSPLGRLVIEGERERLN